MHSLERALNFLLHKYDLRGKRTLVKLINSLSPYGLFARSVYGVDILLNYDDDTWQACCYGYKNSVIPQMLESIPEDACFIDIGANIGIFSLLAGKKLNRDGIVISFEVNPVTYYKLVRNIEKNKLDCLVIPMNVGISSNFKVTSVTYNEIHTGVSHITDEKQSGVDAVVSSLAGIGFVNETIKDKEIFIKIDVEGLEYEVIKSISDILSNKNVVKMAIEIDENNLNRYKTTSKELYGLLSELGYSPTINVNGEKSSDHFDEIFVKN